MKNIVIIGFFFLGGISFGNAQCKTVTSLSENFDNWSDINKCWDTKSGLAMLYAKNKKITFYSMLTPREDMYLITPKLKAGNYTISLDISDNGGDTALELVSIQNKSNKKTYYSLTKSSKIIGGKKTLDFILKKDSHLGIKVLLNAIHQAVYVDNVSIKPRK